VDVISDSLRVFYILQEVFSPRHDQWQSDRAVALSPFRDFPLWFSGFLRFWRIPRPAVHSSLVCEPPVSPLLPQLPFRFTLLFYFVTNLFFFPPRPPCFTPQSGGSSSPTRVPSFFMKRLLEACVFRGPGLLLTIERKPQTDSGLILNQ